MHAKLLACHKFFLVILVATFTGLVIPSASLTPIAKGQDFDQTNFDISDAAYTLLTERTLANRTNFFVYQDADSGFNHGFLSGFFGTIAKINLDTGCINDPNSANGCSTDPNRLDRNQGTVLRVSFSPLSSGEFAGVNIEEPRNWGGTQIGKGYDLRGATQMVFEVRSPGGIKVQFGVGNCTTTFITLPPSSTFTNQVIPFSSLNCQPNLTSTHILFAVATNNLNAPNGGTILLDNIRFEPVPTSQQTALSFPLSTQTFGAIPRQNPAPGRVPFPPDQVNRNVTTIYESALTLWALLKRGTPTDLSQARLIADTFYYALYHDNHGDPIPVSPGEPTQGCFDGQSNAPRCGLHSSYMSGDIALLNNQGTGAGQAGDVRLSGFSCGIATSGFCLVLDGTTGGNNAFVILALAEAYHRLNDERYLEAARKIGEWIVDSLKDNTGTGYGGYYLGYPDEGIVPKTLIKGKSVENNADIFAAFTILAEIESGLGNTAKAAEWTARANVAGDFVMEMFDPGPGRFYAGTVPDGTSPGSGICPKNDTQRGNDIINSCDFIDSETFTTLAMAASPRYQNAIDWRRPIQFALNNFDITVTVGSQSFSGFNIVSTPTAGPNGVAWEFTGQMVVAMRFVDGLYKEARFENEAAFYLNQIRQAQISAPFADGQGLVGSTMQNGDVLPPLEQCLSTPFQCIPERVGLVGTTWAIFADQNLNPLQIPSKTYLPLIFAKFGQN